MKAETLRNALNAHGWVGLVISVPLFIVFWTGAITLFHPELQRWATLPNYPITESRELTNLNQLVDDTLQKYDVDQNARISLRLPSDHMPYLYLFFQKPKEEGRVREFVTLAVDPNTGKTLYDESPFELADFLYELHYNLKLPQGAYIVGIVTLFFLVLIMTGILLQLKNLIAHFFLYRKDGTTRYKMNDLHNVVGVISLPFGLMYAVTGLMFNLAILLQIPAALLLYQGDIDALTKDAGVVTFNEKPTGKAMPMMDINALMRQIEQEAGAEITAVNLHNYGDETAVYRIVGKMPDGFADRYDAHYEVKTNSFPEHLNVPPGNVFTAGTSILFSMHFANFAGADMRFLFFVLAIGVCGMIVAGNVLWIVKRQKRAMYPKTLATMRGLTLGGCVGIIPATALAILLERILPVSLEERAQAVQLAFAVLFLAFVIFGFVYRNYRKFVGWGLVTSATLLFVAVSADWILFGNALTQLVQNGFNAPLNMSLAFGVSGVLLGILSCRLLKSDVDNVTQLELDSAPVYK